MKFGDKVEYGSDEYIISNLTSLHSELLGCRLNIPLRSNDDYIGFALQKLVTYASVQINRLTLLINSPIDFYAWISRNLFECYLITLYIISDQENAKKFVSQKAIDELEIYKGVLSLKNSQHELEYEKPILLRIEHIKNTLSKHGLEEGKPWRVFDLANKTGRKDEYDAFFKLYSKYVHPSSWLVNANENEVDNITYRNIFLLQSQYYVGCLLQTISEYTVKTSK